MNVNRQRILRIADTIENKLDWRRGDPEDKGFSMGLFNYSCGTPGCIGGWAYAHAVEEGVIPIHLSNYGVSDEICAYLGIDVEQAEVLFYPKKSRGVEKYSYLAIPGEEGQITARHAAAVLRHLAETGEVDWSVQPVDLETEPVIDELINSAVMTEEVTC